MKFNARQRLKDALAVLLHSEVTAQKTPPAPHFPPGRVQSYSFDDLPKVPQWLEEAYRSSDQFKQSEKLQANLSEVLNKYLKQRREKLAVARQPVAPKLPYV